MRDDNRPAGIENEPGMLTRLWRRKGTFAAVFLLVAGAVAAAFIALPKSYLAMGAVMVVPSDPLVGATSPASEQMQGDPADLESQSLVLQSPHLLRQMLERPEITAALLEECDSLRQASWLGRLEVLPGQPISCKRQIADEGRTIRWLSGHFVAGLAGRSRVIHVGYWSPLPSVARTMTNGLIDSYLMLGMADKLQSRDAAVKWLQSEIAGLGADLRSSEIKLETYRRINGLVRGQAALIASERLTQLGHQLAVAEAARAAAAAKLQGLRNSAGETRQTLESRTIADLKQQLSEVSGSVARVSSAYGSRHPGLVELQQQRDDIQRRLDTETRRISVSLQHDYDSAVAEVAALRDQLEQLKQEVSAGDSAEAQIANIVRDADVKRQIYVDLSKKVNELEAERRVLTGGAQLVNYAELPSAVWFPKRLPFAVTGFMLASVLAGAASVIRDRTDRTVRSAGDLEALFGIRVLGHIPRATQIGRKGLSAAYQQIGRPSALQEAIRSLYAECMLVNDGSCPRTLLLSSSNPGDGKTFLALVLARFVAATGRRVLAIEGDLRHPGFRTALDVHPAPGLTELLRGTVTISDVIRPTPTVGLDVILAGTPAIDSTELLTNGRIDELLRWATDKYDLVLLDSPPSQMLMDAQILARQVDGILYCTRWARSPVHSVGNGIRDLEIAGGKVIGLVICMVEQSRYGLYGTRPLHATPYLKADA